MKNSLRTILSKAMLAAVLVGSFMVLIDTPASAQITETKKQAQDGITAIGGGPGGTTSLTSTMKTVISVLLFIVGAVAVVMIIFSGIQYVTSSGDPARVKKAKDTLIYSIVGLVVAILAFAIVNFVLGSLT